MKPPSVTVITPTYNRRQVLARAIDSVRCQSVADYEHIIVDDGSSDGTDEMVAGYRDKRIRYFALPQRSGANTARNLGIEKARAPVLSFLDSDDQYEPFRLRYALATLEENPSIPLMLSSFVINWRQGPHPAVNIAAIIDGDRFERALAWRVVHIAGTSITARREAVKQIGGFNPHLRRMQDRDLLLRMANIGPVVLSDRIDWIKHNSPDALTLGADVGGVEAFGDLIEHNDSYRSRFPELIPYFVALRILNEIKKWRLGAARKAFNENLKSPSLGFSASDLFRSYLTGRKHPAATEVDFDLRASGLSANASSRSGAALAGNGKQS